MTLPQTPEANLQIIYSTPVRLSTGVENHCSSVRSACHISQLSKKRCSAVPPQLVNENEANGAELQISEPVGTRSTDLGWDGRRPVHAINGAKFGQQKSIDMVLFHLSPGYKPEAQG